MKRLLFMILAASMATIGCRKIEVDGDKGSDGGNGGGDSGGR